MKRRREIAQRVVVRFLVAQQVPLQLDADVAAAEHPDQPIDQAADAEPRTVDGGAAGQRDQAADVAVEIVERQRALAFRRRQLHPRQQPAEIAVAVTRRDEDGQTEETGLGLGIRGSGLGFGAPERRALSDEGPSATVSSAPTIAFSPARLAAR